MILYESRCLYHHHHCLDTYDIPILLGQIATFSLVQSWQSPALFGETPSFASEHSNSF
jgi:hypothetical protein